VKVVGIRLKIMMFATVLILVGCAISFYGISMCSNVLNPERLMSGTYIAVVGAFLAIAGFLVLMAQIFMGRSVLY
jgi:hypothetical protein